jgi:hypothetical protein
MDMTGCIAIGKTPPLNKIEIIIPKPTSIRGIIFDSIASAIYGFRNSMITNIAATIPAFTN